MIKELDAKTIANMFLAGAKNLQSKKEIINELNVFPVPDGDTGTNMTMTIMTAAKEVFEIKNMNMSILSKKLSSGSLKGARGNSGVILSQLLRGFSKGIENFEKVNVEIIAESFVKATETAYKAVMKPKEGTILTVARSMSDKALEIYNDVEDIQEFFEEILKEGQKTLEYTPELLPVLKEAGVVDSGGEGLMQILYGAYDYFIGKDIDLTTFEEKEEDNAKVEHTVKRGEISTADIKFGYCTEFIVKLDKPLNNVQRNEFKDFILTLGDSLVFVDDDEMIKIHVHTNNPGKVIEQALTFGELTRIKIDNMREEHREIIEEEGYDVKTYEIKKVEETKEYGFVSVAVGSGLASILESLGVDYIVEGGQTMNPSTQDIVDAIQKVNAKNVFVLPNNKNIILAANQAAEIITDKNVYIIPTTTIPQGITAILNFDEDSSVDEILSEMNEAIKQVVSGEVTYAVRDTHIDNFDIKKDDIMGISDDGIKSVGSDINDTTISLIKAMLDDDKEVISVYYGKDVDEKTLDDFNNKIEKEFADYDVEVLEGAQPVYYYIVSVE